MKFLTGYLFTLLLSATAVLSCIGCENAPWSRPDTTAAVDSALVAEQVQAIVNPQFGSVQELIVFRQQTNEGYSIDSTFRALPEQTLNNVASVVIKRKGSVDKKGVVEEYRANKAVYDNLPQPAVTPQNDPPQSVAELIETDAESKPGGSDVISTSYQYKDSIINGKQVKIQIKKEESYVRE